MKITSHNKTFEWRLRLVERRYAEAALLGTALLNPLLKSIHLHVKLMNGRNNKLLLIIKTPPWPSADDLILGRLDPFCLRYPGEDTCFR